MDGDLLFDIVGSDARITPILELGISRFKFEDACASLSFEAQDIGPFPPNAIIVAVSKGKKYYIVLSRMEVPEISSCRGVWDEGEKKQQEFFKIYQNTGSEQAIKNSRLAEEKAYSEYRQCHMKEYPKSPIFSELVKKAEALIQRIPKQ